MELMEWGTSSAGAGYGGQVGERWCAVLETRRGYHRGNHVHGVDQFTVLLSGDERVVMMVDGGLVEAPLVSDRVHVTPAGVPHVTLAYEDSVAYEWWDGSSAMTECRGVFDEVIEKFKERIRRIT